MVGLVGSLGVTCSDFLQLSGSKESELSMLLELILITVSALSLSESVRSAVLGLVMLSLENTGWFTELTAAGGPAASPPHPLI